MRLLAWIGRRGRITSAVIAAIALIAGAWVGIAQIEAQRPGTGAPSGEMAEREALKESVRELFDKAQYSSLERLAGFFRDSAARTPSGVWKLTVFYGAFHDMTGAIGRDDAAGWQKLSAKLADWQGQFAAKPTARVVQAIALKSYAWSLRPRSFVQEASTGADARFLAALHNARDLLDHDAAIASADPHYFVLRADIGAALGQSPDELMAVVDQGRVKFPGYFALDFSGLDYFAAGDGTKAIGPAEAARIEAFAATAASAAGPDADQRYARLYWHAYAAIYGKDLFKQSRVNWPRMRDGMNSLVAQYPDAWNINSFAYLACIAGDRQTTQHLMARLPERPLVLAVWQARAVFASCRKWASGGTQAAQ